MKRRICVRGGFTVVEMLVVIAIIGVLAALLLPAIQNAREQGRQAECLNKARTLGQAAIAYNTSKGNFPPLRKQVTNTGGTNSFIGWPATLLPELGENGLADQLDANVRSGSPNPQSVFAGLKTLICSTDISPSTDDTLKLSYGANSGCPNDYSNAELDHLGNGVFFDQAAALGRSKKFLMSDFLDGASNTLLFMENVDIDTWPSLSATGLDASTAGQTELAGSIVWYPGTDSSSNADPNTPPVVNPSTFIRTPNVLIGHPDAGRSVVNLGMFGGTNGWQYASPSSRHPTVIVAAFGDGSTRKMNKTLDYGVYYLLMSSNGQKSYDPADGTPPLTKIDWQATRRLSADSFE